MTLRSYGSLAAAAVILLAVSACGTQAVPSGNGANPAMQVSNASATHSRPPDTTSILNKLTKDIVIGSTVDSGNGDQGPRALSIAPGSHKGVLTKGQLLVCNFADSAGVAGNGTTMEILDPKPNSTPVRFFQSAALKGCDGTAIQPHNGYVYGAGLTSGKIIEISKNRKVTKTYSGKLIDAPLADTAADHTQDFSPFFIYAGSTASGGILSISVGFYGNGLATQVAKGFSVGKQSGQQLGPAGLQYDLASDTLYILDGIDDTVVAFSNASKLLGKDEIVVQSGGKTFKCKYPKTTCGSLVYSGSPIDAPVASTLLPNGNLIVANSQGTANTLVELTPAGQVLATKVVDTSSTQGVFGLAAGGKNDKSTVLFFTDSNSNTVHELKQ
jgi:hypothetical protein